ncbi:MAG: AAA family ATPase, partial [Thermoguttaceae bacterium]|nr:AAA family ATPase [Thermoguttaceae bacterium]
DAVEVAYEHGGRRCWAFIDGAGPTQADDAGKTRKLGVETEIDDEKWTLVGFSADLRCEDCSFDFPEIEPGLFNEASVRGACAFCAGFGRVAQFDEELVFPKPNRSIHDGAVAPWNVKAYGERLTKFLKQASDLGVRIDVPFSELTRKERSILFDGDPARTYEGINGFLGALQKQKYKMHIRSYLSRWRSYRECPDCQGAKLRSEALAVKICGYNINDLNVRPISETIKIIDSWDLSPERRKLAKLPLAQLRARLGYLERVGLGYLTLSRPTSALSSGESRRVALTAALGSELIDALYVLDEPTLGLHPRDSEILLRSILELRDRGNTVVAVEHDATVLEAADKVVEFGPEAGDKGGKIVFEGTVAEMKAATNSLTGDYLSGR